MSSNSKKLPFFLLIITCTLFVLLLVHTAFIVIPNKNAPRYHNPEVSSTVVRGEITDRNGKLLAIQTSKYNLYFRLSEIDDLPEAALFISPYIKMSQQEILKRTQAYSKIALIKRGLSMLEAAELEEVLKQSTYKNKIYLERYDGRTYPSSFHACQTIGFVNSSNVGLEGIELSYNDLLLPYPELGNETTYGDDVVLTLDLDMQYLLDVQTQEISETHNPDYVMGMIMGAKDGEIYAISSYPWYDLAASNTSSDNERMNRCISYTYEPGSVFKIFTLAWCIEQGVDINEPFICDGEETFTVDGKSFTISCHEAHGKVDGEAMIEKSCNGAISYWVMQTDQEAFREYLTSLGFSKKLDLNLPGVTSGYLAPLSSWSNRTQATLAFGQEISVNALQVITAATAFTNDGYMLSPSIVKCVKNHKNQVVEENSLTYKKVFSKETADKVVSYMEKAVESGTAKKAGAEGVKVAAKTGTAEIINEVTKSYQDGSSLASTISFVPADDPKYIIYFAVSAPKGDSIWGANVAAPSVSAIIQGLINQGKVRSSSQELVQLSN